MLMDGVPNVQPSERLTAVTGTRAALLYGLIGIGAIGTFLVNILTSRVTAQTFKLTQRGYLTDRYSKAIEQLGSETLDVRLGGIYALEQLATDSDQASDQATIVEVLSAFVRVHSDPVYRLRQHQFALNIQVQLSNSPGEQAKDEQAQAREHVAEYALPEDVQAAVTVLGRLPVRAEVEHVRADLSKAWLRGADLHGADLSGANLDHVNLSKANLDGACLVSARLTNTNMIGASLREANLERANADCSDLTSADMSGAILKDTSLQICVLAGTDLREAQLGNTLVRGSSLTTIRGLKQSELESLVGDGGTDLPEWANRPTWWSTEMEYLDRALSLSEQRTDHGL